MLLLDEYKPYRNLSVDKSAPNSKKPANVSKVLMSASVFLFNSSLYLSISNEIFVAIVFLNELYNDLEAKKPTTKINKLAITKKTVSFFIFFSIFISVI